MKKILAFLLCTVLICAVPVVASAEGAPADANETVVENLPTAEETPTEAENSASETIPEKTITENIVDYVTANFDKAVVIIVMAAYSIIESRLRGKTIGTIGKLNNNAITIAENSASSIKTAFERIENIAEVVNNFQDKIDSLLEEFRKNAEEKNTLEDTLNHVETFLKTAKLATLELSNTVSELICLSNIPNSKKETFYGRHIKAVNALEAAEEVMSNDGKEA